MGNKKKKMGKNRLDKFYYMAKEQGYRARAAFKLIQLNKKYDFLSNANGVLDLCAAPGSWLQVCSKFCPVSCKMIGVDLDSIRPIKNCHLLQEDITTPKCRSEIIKILGKNGKVDVVLHDGAPNVGTQWNQDAYSQAELVLHAFKLATEFLEPGGSFVTKVFRSGDYNSLLWVFKQLFKKVDANKPPASRNTSAEIFVVCRGYLAPKKIDPKIFDPREVFKTVEEPAKKPDVLSSKKPKPNREGYEEGAFILFKKVGVSKFIISEDPVRMLSDYNELYFDEDSDMFKEHKETTPEIFRLCEDLKVLGKSDFKYLLKWRQRMRAYLDSQKEQTKEEDDDENKEDETKDEEDTEEAIDAELNERIESLKKKEKKKLRKLREKKKKAQRKIDLKMTIPGDYIDQSDKGVFTLTSINDSNALEQISKAVPDTVVEDESEDDDLDINLEDFPQKEYDGNYSDYLEEYLDDMYEQYQVGKKRAKKSGTRLHDSMTLDDLPGLADDEAHFESEKEREEGEELSEPEEEERDRNPLLVENSILKKSSAHLATKRWFEQQEFQKMDEDNESEDEAYIKKLKEKVLRRKAEKNDEQVQVSDEEKVVTKKSTDDKPDQRVQERDDSSDEDSKPPKKKQKQKKEDFEEVPIDQISDFSDEEDEALAMAIGNALVNKTISKEDLEDYAFNKYAFNDHDILPKWFADEEVRHSQPQMPVTKAEVDEAKLKFKLINARPIKKVAEAKAKKKLRTAKKVEKLRKQTEVLVDSTEMSPQEKARAIEQLYKQQRALSKEKISKTYLVSKKGGGKVTAAHKGKVVGKKKVKLVDRRLKKDLRAQKASEAKKGKKKKSLSGKRKRR